MLRKFTILVAILALTTMACGFNVNVPRRAEPGPEVTENIRIPYPDEEEVSLKLSFGAGEMTLSPGADGLVEGTATYNYEQVKPQVKTDGGTVQVRMGETHVNFLPSYNNLKNEWNFKLGSQPVDLSIESGAYKGEFEFGGLALTSLTIKDGAADVALSFSEPNPVEMSIFQYATGASNVKLTGLANANFSLLNFSSGAGDYTLDFSGELQRDASVTIETGLSNVIIIVPEGVNAVVTVEGGLSNISAGPGWSQSGNVYKQSGEGPTLTFVIEMGMGNLTLTR
ncbi:MAG TPA: toast rack family protein [Anaerolineales bacterium]|nr:toast rack family protein [Anaerolineales bacterium]